MSDLGKFGNIIEELAGLPPVAPAEARKRAPRLAAAPIDPPPAVGDLLEPPRPPAKPRKARAPKKPAKPKRPEVIGKQPDHWAPPRPRKKRRPMTDFNLWKRQSGKKHWPGYRDPQFPTAIEAILLAMRPGIWYSRPEIYAATELRKSVAQVMVNRLILRGWLAQKDHHEWEAYIRMPIKPQGGAPCPKYLYALSDEGVHIRRGLVMLWL